MLPLRLVLIEVRMLDGFTCTPEIAPPVARTVDRDSGTFGVETYEYGGVEIAVKLDGITISVLLMASCRY